MKNRVILSVMSGGIALILGGCATGNIATQTALYDDVYNSEVEAKALTFTPRPAANANNHSYDYSTDDYAYEEENRPRLDIENRNEYNWRDHYYNNNLAFDPYFDPAFSMGWNNWGWNSWNRPGFGFNLGWNNWGWNNWNLGWNNWGWNNWGWNSWAYNPWYSPLGSPYWGIYSFNNPWGGGWIGNGGLWGGGFYPGIGVITRPNNPRPSRGSVATRPVNADGSSVSRIPRPTGPVSSSRPAGTSSRPTRESYGGDYSRPATSGTRPSSSGSSSRPTESSRPTRSEAQQSRPARTESSRPARTERPSYSPSPSYSPPSSSGSSSGGSSRGSSGGSSSGGGRPSR